MRFRGEVFNVISCASVNIWLRRLPVRFQLYARDYVFIGQLTFVVISADFLGVKNIAIVGRFLEAFPVTYPQILTIYFNDAVVWKFLYKIYAFKKH